MKTVCTIIIMVGTSVLSSGQSQPVNGGPTAAPTTISTGTNRGAVTDSQPVPHQFDLLREKAELDNRIGEDIGQITQLKAEQAQAALKFKSSVWLQDRYKTRLASQEAELANAQASLRIVMDKLNRYYPAAVATTERDQLMRERKRLEDEIDYTNQTITRLQENMGRSKYDGARAQYQGQLTNMQTELTNSREKLRIVLEKLNAVSSSASSPTPQQQPTPLPIRPVPTPLPSSSRGGLQPSSGLQPSGGL